MKCKYCGYENTEQEPVCKNCGNYNWSMGNNDNNYFAIDQNVAIPDGFLYDPASGLYYHTEFVQGENGEQQQLVTYYDAYNGSYTQVSYPMEEEMEQATFPESETINDTITNEIETSSDSTELEENLPQNFETGSKLADTAQADARQLEFSEQGEVAPNLEVVEVPSYSAEAEEILPKSLEGEIARDFETRGEVSIPEGFIYDPNSGWYYYTEFVHGENGEQQQLVTYYDAYNGSYTQVSYPMEEETEQDTFQASETIYDNIQSKTDAFPNSLEVVEASESIEVEAVSPDNLEEVESPENAEVEAILPNNLKLVGISSNRAQKEDISLEGQETQKELQYSSQTKVVQVPAENLQAPTKQLEYPETANKDYPKTETMSTDYTNTQASKLCPQNSQLSENNVAQNVKNDTEKATGNSDKKGIKKKIIIATSIILVIGAIGSGAFILGKQGKLPFLNKLATTDTGSGQNDIQAMAEQTSEDTNDLIVQTDIDAMWDNNPNCSFLYSSACEDDNNVYFMHQLYDNNSASRLCRMNKEGGPIEEIISESDLHRPIQSFAIMDEYIYFNIEMGEAFSAYFRIPKNGGDAEFLFINEFSYIKEHNGLLYFLFSKQDVLGIYNLDEDEAPKTCKLNNEEHSNFNFIQAFSICDDNLYYGIYYDKPDNTQGQCFYKFNINNTSKELLLSSDKLGENIILNPFFIDGDAYYTQINDINGNAYLRVLKNGESKSKVLIEVTDVSEEGDTIVAARVGNSVLYRIGNKIYSSPIDNLSNRNILCESTFSPSAISQHWILFADRAVSMDGHNSNIFGKIEYVPLGNTDKALVEAEEIFKYTLSDLGNDLIINKQDNMSDEEKQKLELEASELQKAIEQEKNDNSQSNNAQKQSQKWVDNTGYKPKYFTWSKSEYSSQNIDNAEIPTGKWVNENGDVVAYISYESSPDTMDFEIYYKGKVYQGYADVVQDGNSQAGLCEKMNIFFYLDTLTHEVLLAKDDTITTLKLVKAKY